MGPVARFGYKSLVYFEKLFKQTLFDCRMCGACHLSKNGMVCCMNCPKGLRNGPCGGTGIDGTCEVEGIGECVWHKIYRRSALLHTLARTEKVKPALDWSLQGTSSYLNLWTGRDGSFEGRGMRWKIKSLLGLERSKSTDSTGAAP
ncbi:methylenetetrahydrofolate reductase C-terminal domain-containing protein [bacterium]|nr:methylenetetrahydrofolate reductase C-terminal domain-containing protein [bacterium]